MSWSYYTYTKENVLVDDIQKIVNEFPNDWFFYGEGSDRSKKPIRQSWGWSTIVDINNPWHNYKDDDHGFGIVDVISISGTGCSFEYGKEVNNFVVDKLKEFGYTVLYEYFSY